MPESYDVASRLALGRSAVETVQGYVWACRQLGFQHQDLTLNASQVEDWYGTEEGMDLAALQRGCLALDAAVRSSQDALTVQDRQLARLPAVWQGVGGQAAHDFLNRHADASAAVAAAVQTAAEALGALREELWRAVGEKVDAVIAIEARAAGTRDEWTAAAHTVTTGVGDRAAASELVDRAVKPFVHNAIGSEWLATMQTTMASVAAAYDRAVAEIDAEPSPVFEVPGDFGPAWTPPESPAEPECYDEPRCAPAAMAPAPAASTPAASTPAAAPTVPAAWSAPAPTSTPEPAAVAPLPGAPPALAAPSTPTAPPMPALGSMGSGLGQQFADTLGGLLGGVGGLGGGELPDPPEVELNEPELEEPEVEEVDEEEPEPEEEALEESEPEEPEAEETVVAGEAEPVEEPCEPPVEPIAAPAPEPAPPPADPLPPAEPLAAEQTPCEIAAEEVPQVGEPEG